MVPWVRPFYFSHPFCLRLPQQKPRRLLAKTLCLLPAALLLAALAGSFALPPGGGPPGGGTFAALSGSGSDPGPGPGVVQAAELQALYSLDELEQALAAGLAHRVEGLHVRYLGDAANLTAAVPLLVEGLLQKDDYLRYSLRGWRWRWSGTEGDLRLSFLFEHLTTGEEEAFVSAEVARILGRIITPAMDDHHKVKAIHDYVVASVAYDTALEGRSAYAALAQGKAVCQGYALLIHKMLETAGVESRIISGRAGGENHAWNLVRLEGNWYHLDATWNSPTPDVPGRVLYAYYNRTDAAMAATHTWEQDKYPAAAVPYRAPAGMRLDAAILTAYAGERWPAPPGSQPADKTWVIRFDRELNPATVHNRQIFVADRRANLYPVRVHTGDDSRFVYVVPTAPYPAGETLYLLLGRGLRSRTGEALAKPVWMEFSVR